MIRHDSEMQRVAGSQAGLVQIGKSSRFAEVIAVQRKNGECLPHQRINAASTSPRTATSNWRMRTFMDSAAENSVATQSLITNLSGTCFASQPCTSDVRRSCVNAATIRLVSR